MTTGISPPQIAIIGTEGSGKTVLTTVLAKRYSQANGDGVFLNPLDNSTLKFVERTFHTLSSGDWPPSSPVGQLFKLRWQLQIKRDPPCACEIRLVDSAGQDLRQIFGNDQQIESLPDHLKGLAEYCRTADIVICLVNLRDFVGEKDPLRRVDNEAVIKSALEFLIADESRTRHLCVLFTQIDQFGRERDRCGGWPNVAHKYLPYVHGAHLGNGKTTVGAVAAVKDTRVIELDGAPRRVPAPSFKSEGLDRLMVWMTDKVRAAIETRSIDAELERAFRQADEDERGRSEKRERRNRAVRWLLKKIGWLSAIIVPLLVYLATTPRKPLTFSLRAAAPVATSRIEFHWLKDDFHFRNTSDHAIYDVKADVDLSASARNAGIYPLTCPRIGPGEDFKWSSFADVPTGTTHQLTWTADWFHATVGVECGRIWDDVWIRNESAVSAKNIVLNISITSKGAAPPRHYSLSVVPSLSRGETYRWPNSVSVGRDDRVECELTSFDDS